LEGCELYKDDWRKVAEHVNFALYQGNPVRSLDDCILAFLRFVRSIHLKLLIF
jgi:hypothetical protein